MKKAALIAAISMGVLIITDIIYAIGEYFSGLGMLLYILTIAAKAGVGYFFFSYYKKQ